MNREVVITGLGVVTPNGIGIKDFWHDIASGISAAQTLEKAKRRGYGSIQACVVPDFSIKAHFSKDIKNGKVDKKALAKLRPTDKSIRMAALATKLALDDSGLEYDPENNNLGCYLGNAEEAIQSQERVTEEVFQRIMKKTFDHFKGSVKPFHFLQVRREFRKYEKILANKDSSAFIDLINEEYGNLHDFTPPNVINFKSYALAGKTSSIFNFHGPSMAINTACASGLDAIGHAYLTIKSGITDYMIAGGSEAPIAMQTISTLDNLGVISKTSPKPFCIDRDGFAIADGAGIVILEEKNHALKRRAHIYVEVKGYSQSIDGNVQPCAINKKGTHLKQTIKDALSMAELNPNQIDYINVHGTATQDCELVETRVIKSVFGSHAYKLNLSGTKPMTGHSIGAIGGIEAIITCLAIKENLIPPTINLYNLDPECDLNNTPNTAQGKTINNAAILSMGFGGYNCTLLVGENKK